MVATPTDGIAGIDVSHYQGEIDWNAVAAHGARFAFIKATEGVDNVDPQFATNWQAAHAAGLLRGAYHYFDPSQDAAKQADHFLQTVTMDDASLPPVVDVEVSGGLSPSDLSSALRVWLEKVAEGSGSKPIIYADPTFWRSHIVGDFSEYPFWIAEYGPEAHVPDDWSSWTFWQHSQSGQVPGVTGPVDMDRFAGNEKDLEDLTGKKGLFSRVDRLL